MKKRFFSVVLTIWLIAGLLSVMTLQVGASRNRRKVAFGICDFSNASTNYVYLGEDNSNPIKWRVLAECGGNNGTYQDVQNNAVSSDDAMFLLTEYLLGEAMPFSASGEANWESSEYRTWMNGTLYNGLFTDVEKANVLKTTTTSDVSVGGYSSYPFLDACQLNEDALFALSAGEATSDNYDFNRGDDSTRVAHIGDETGTTESWWLRNRQTELAQTAGLVYGNGNVGYATTTSNNYTRPAMNFDTNAIFLSKAADFDKSTIFSTPSINDEGTEWTLTLSDGNSSFNASMVNMVVVPGGNITVNISDLGTGADYTQVSAVFADGDEILSYGKIGDAATGDRTFTLPLEIRPGQYDLYLFAEDVNGAYRTDYASSYISIKVDITETYWSDDGIRADSFSQIDTTAKTISITTPQELGLLAYQVNQREDYLGYTVTLANDIDLAGYLWQPAGLLMDDESGSDVRAFSGTFDGNGKRIENMLIVDAMDTQYVCAGLFGVAGYADIKNLDLSGKMYLHQDSSDVEDIYIGSVCGMSIDAALENCRSDVDITAICDGADFYLGGICGVIATDDSESTPACVVNNCCFGGEIQADICDGYATNNIGGISGVGEEGTVINCAVTGNITVTADAYDINTGKGAEIYAGGVMGVCKKNMSVLNSYCTGDLNASGEAEEFYVGGIAGLIDTASAYNNYFGGRITAEANIDIGYAFGEEDCFPNDSEILIRYNYYDELFDGIKSYSGDINGYATGISDGKMRWYSGTSGALVDLLNANKDDALFTQRWTAFSPSTWFVNDHNNGYPNFTTQTYTVTLNPNGGSILSGNVTSYTQGEGAVLPTSANMSRTDYTFAGWYGNANCTGTAVTKISASATGDKTFWAKWTMVAPTSVLDVVTYKPVVQSYSYGTIGARYVINSPWSGFVVSYLVGDKWTVTPPTAVGEYDIRITRDADENTMAYDSGILKKYFIIRPAESSAAASPSSTSSKPYSESAGVDGQVPYTGDTGSNRWPIFIGVLLSCGAIFVVLSKKKEIGEK